MNRAKRGVVVGLSIATLLYAGSDVRADECVYVANAGSDYVSVIDSATRTNVASFAVEGAPLALAAVPEKRVLYVLTRTGYGETHKVVSLSLDTGAILGCIRGLSSGAYALLLSPDASTVYIPDYYDNTLTAVDLASGQVLQSIRIGGEQYTGESVPTRLALSPDGSRVFAPLPYGGPHGGMGGAISVIDLASGSHTKVTFPTERELPTAYSVLLSADGTLAYVLSLVSQTIAVIDTATNALVGEIPVPSGPRGFGPIALALSPDGRVLYMANPARVASVDLETSKEWWQDLGTHFSYYASLAVSDSGVFVAIENNWQVGTVVVVNPVDTAVEAEIPVGWFPRDIAIANIPGPCRPVDYAEVPTRTPTPSPTRTATIEPDCQDGVTCIMVTSVAAQAGNKVSIEVRLHTDGAQITSIENDLELDLGASFEQCTAGLSAGVGIFGEEPAFLRAIVWEPTEEPFAEDIVLYTCTVDIPRGVQPGSYGVSVSNLEAADKLGNRVPIWSQDGRLDVLAPGESTSGCQASHPPPGSFVSPLVLLGGALCGIREMRRARRH